MAEDQRENGWEKVDVRESVPSTSSSKASGDMRQKPVRPSQMFRYTSRLERLALVVSLVCAIGAGAAVPLMTIVLGNSVGSIKEYHSGLATEDAFSRSMSSNAVKFVYIGVGEFATVWLSTLGFTWIGERNARRVRSRYLEALLKQNIGFFENLGTGEVSNRLAEDVDAIQRATSEKLATILTSLGTFFSAWVVSMILSWRLGLVTLASVVTMLLVLGTLMRFIAKSEGLAREAFNSASEVAGEAIRAIDTIIAYGAQDRIFQEYDAFLKQSEKWGRQVRVYLGLSLGAIGCVIFLNVGLSLWEGSRLLVRHQIEEKHIITITLAMIIGTFSLVYVSRNIGEIASGTSAAEKVFEDIARPSPIDSLSSDGQKLEHGLSGSIKFTSVTHAYPSKPNKPALVDFSLHIKAGQTVALVGPSGSGKSTCVSLLERFYDAGAGSITIDGHDIRTLNVSWLRQHISLVRQDCQLFSASIADNIIYGLVGSEMFAWPADAKLDLVIAAAKLANAHDFISDLPHRYNTLIGGDRTQLSGGQKQRICIARAIVKDPKILLLDEATSALDSSSSAIVQEAIKRASTDRTTLVIAHQLSTIKHADVIVVLAEGQIREQGTHEELISLDGMYKALVDAQDIKQASPSQPEKVLHASGSSTTINDGAVSDGTEAVAGKRASRTEQTLPVHDFHSHHMRPRLSTSQRLQLILGFQQNTIVLFLVGVFASILSGGATPTHVVFFVRSLVWLSYPAKLYAMLREHINFWAGMYLMLGVVIFVTYAVQGVAFGITSNKILYRMRQRVLQTVLQQGMPFFHRSQHTSGALLSLLSSQTASVASVSGMTLGAVISAITTLVAAITLSNVFAWRLGLVCTALFPLIFGGGYLGFRLICLFDIRAAQVHSRANAFATEAVSNVQTVAALTREAEVCEEYRRRLDTQGKNAQKSNMLVVTTYACAQSVFFFVAALGYWWGGRLVVSSHYGLFEFFVSFLEIMFGTLSASAVFSNIADISRAWASAGTLIKLFAHGNSHDRNNVGAVDNTSTPHGHFEIHDVHFEYPDSNRGPVLTGIDIDIPSQHHVALVGPSGGGKSTVLALLERFYEPSAGKILLDGHLVSSIPVDRFRSHISLVTQNPVLISGSVRDNILLGVRGKTIGEETIKDACQQANIWDFLSSLPDGLDTQVGSQGGLFSGGQKQRIAVARALVRNPKILLLDEATSALDSESETAVLQALRKAANGRTIVTVAHRLRTIQDADAIYVIDGGKVVERGTHRELVDQRGLYHKMVQLQGFSDV